MEENKEEKVLTKKELKLKAEEMKLGINSLASKTKAAKIIAEGTANELHYDYKFFSKSEVDEVSEKIKDVIFNAIKHEPTTSIKCLEK